jgi:CheY-like chemotaxis protein
MKILLIDDEPDIRRIGQLALTRVGRFDVNIAPTAQEGIDLARRVQPDAILLDMMMPGMDGMQALAVLKQDEDLKNIPVAFMTARVQRSEMAQYLAAGAVGVVPKPFDPMAVSDIVRGLFGWSDPG